MYAKAYNSKLKKYALCNYKFAVNKFTKYR